MTKIVGFSSLRDDDYLAAAPTQIQSIKMFAGFFVILEMIANFASTHWSFFACSLTESPTQSTVMSQKTLEKLQKCNM